jgi:hypothetical protein
MRAHGWKSKGGPNMGVERAAKAVDRAMAGVEQTAADADQTSADADQTSSDSDQTASAVDVDDLKLVNDRDTVDGLTERADAAMLAMKAEHHSRQSSSLGSNGSADTP